MLEYKFVFKVWFIGEHMDYNFTKSREYGYWDYHRNCIDIIYIEDNLIVTAEIMLSEKGKVFSSF